MTLASLRSEVERFLTLLLEKGVLLDVNMPLVLGGGDESMVTWTRDAGLSAVFAEWSSLDEYLHHLTRRNYSALLTDGSLLQISFSIRRDVICGHRLAYFPCPIKFESADLEEGHLDELIQAATADELREKIRLVTPVRFDFDPKSAKEFHPASHLTIQRKECRIPVHAPLSLGHFVRTIFLHFYPEHWHKLPDLSSWPISYSAVTLDGSERPFPHISWVSGGGSS